MKYESREMCPCCCGEGKSDLPQWQEEQIEVMRIKSECYGWLHYVCSRTGFKWQTGEQIGLTELSKSYAIEFAEQEKLKKGDQDGM